jgi:hypothetical protein
VGVQFDLDSIIRNHTGRGTPETAQKAKAWVRFHPDKVDVARIVKTMQKDLCAELTQPTVEVVREVGPPEVRVYRNPHLALRVTTDAQTYAARARGEIRAEITPAEDLMLLELTVAAENEAVAWSGKDPRRLEYLVKVPGKQVLTIPFVVPERVGGEASIWMRISYRPLPVPYRRTLEERVVHEIRLEVPVRME